MITLSNDACILNESGKTLKAIFAILWTFTFGVLLIFVGLKLTRDQNEEDNVKIRLIIFCFLLAISSIYTLSMLFMGKLGAFFSC